MLRFAILKYLVHRKVTKVVLIWELEPTQIFKLFPANSWILKLSFLKIFAINIILDDIYGLLNILEF